MNRTAFLIFCMSFLAMESVNAQLSEKFGLSFTIHTADGGSIKGAQITVTDAYAQTDTFSLKRNRKLFDQHFAYDNVYLIQIIHEGYEAPFLILSTLNVPQSDYMGYEVGGVKMKLTPTRTDKPIEHKHFGVSHDEAIDNFSIEAFKTQASIDSFLAFHMGLSFIKRGEIAKAFKEFLHAEQLNPEAENPKLYYILGFCFLELDQMERACEYFKKCRALGYLTKDIDYSELCLDW